MHGSISVFCSDDKTRDIDDNDEKMMEEDLRRTIDFTASTTQNLEPRIARNTISQAMVV